MAATQHLAVAARNRDLELLYGLAHILIAERLDRSRLISTRTPCGFEEFAAHVASFTPERVAAATGLSSRWRCDRLARTIHDGQARFVLVDDGRQPEPPRRAHGAGHDQPGADDRQHRPARHRGQFDHRPVQRDGLAAVQQHDEPAGRPRFSAMPHDRQHVAQLARTSTRHESRDKTSWAYNEIIEGILAGKIKASVGRRHQSGPFVDQSESARATCSSRLDFLVVQDMYHTTETAQQRRPGAACRRLGREGGNVHQLRAAHRRAEESRAARGQALADFAIFKLVADYWGVGPMFEANGRRRKPCSRSSSGFPRGSRAISAAFPTTRLLDERGGVQWPYPADEPCRHSKPNGGCSPTASSSMPTAGPA